VFWRGPTRVVAITAQIVAINAVTWTAALVLLAPFYESGFISDSPIVHGNLANGTSLGVLAVAWLVSGLRRTMPERASSPDFESHGTGFRSSDSRKAGDLVRGVVAAAVHPLVVLPVGLAFVAAVGLGTGLAVPTALALVAFAAVALLWGNAFGQLVGTSFGLWAPIVVGVSHPRWIAVVGAGAAVALAECAVKRARAARPASLDPGAVVMTVGALCVAVGSALGSLATANHGVAVAIAVIATWALAVDLDRARVPALGDIARVAMLFGLAATPLRPAVAIIPLAVTAALFALDAIRLDRPWLACGAAVAVQPLIAAAATTAGLTRPQVGVALALAAIVWAGMAGLVKVRWQQPLAGAAGLGLLGGLAFAIGNAEAVSAVLLIAGGLGIGAAIFQRSPVLGHFGGGLMTVGLVIHFVHGGVVASEPYLAPIALHLVVAGYFARRANNLSSWVAYGPAVVILGGAAVTERLNGGAGWHALIAGAVGLVAVLVGGERRLAGPLFLGTGLLVTTTFVEVMGQLAGVPTWAWLAAGGSVLLAAGVAMERADTTPIDATRRLVDAVTDNFN
jgi:hypothetical protein